MFTTIKNKFEVVTNTAAALFHGAVDQIKETACWSVRTIAGVLRRPIERLKLIWLFLRDTLRGVTARTVSVWYAGMMAVAVVNALMGLALVAGFLYLVVPFTPQIMAAMLLVSFMIFAIGLLTESREVALLAVVVFTASVLGQLGGPLLMGLVLAAPSILFILLSFAAVYWLFSIQPTDHPTTLMSSVVS